MAAKNVVCVTTFRQGNSENHIEKVRTEVFMDTANKMADFVVQWLPGSLALILTTRLAR